MEEYFNTNELVLVSYFCLAYFLAFDGKVFRFFGLRISLPYLIVKSIIVVLIEGFVSSDPFLKLIKV